HGTTFKIFLPRHAAEATREAAPEEVTSERGVETILLVEDEDLLRAVVCEALEEHGYHVLDASTPADALKFSSTFDGPIHLLLTDVIMPDVNGKELARRIAADRPETKVIF